MSPTKAKSVRGARSSPSQKKSSSIAVAAAAAALPHQPSLGPSTSHLNIPRVAGTSGVGSTNSKRARPASSDIGKDSGVKRSKSGTIAPSASVQRPRPASPSTSSRSRPRRPAKNRQNSGTGDEGSRGTHVLAAATSAAAPRNRPAQRSRSSSRAPPLPHLTSCFSVDGCALTSDVRVPQLSKRLFGHEIQCLMHAFGEVRYCARDVLEIVEDSVRDVVCRVAKVAIEEAGVGELVRMSHVAGCLRGDARAMQRLNLSLKHSAELHKDKLPQNPTERTFVHVPHPWELFAELGHLGSTDGKAAAVEKVHSGNDMMSVCSWRALHAFRIAMGTQLFQDFAMCRGVSLVRQKSRSRVPTIRDQPRLVLFREWLGLSPSLNARMPDETLFALGHVAWEAIGLITQTALLHRYFDDLAKGFGDPRASEWSYSRHLVAALNYGLGTAIMVPFTDMQAIGLRQEIDKYLAVLQGGSQRWRGHSHSSSPCLLPQHMREALRRLGREPDKLWGLREQSFLLSPGLL